LTAPYDGSGNFCGVGDYSDYPYLLVDFEGLDAWTPPTPKDVFKNTVCVKECPFLLKDDENYMKQVDCKPNDIVTDCPTHKFLSKNMWKICIPKTGGDVPPQLGYY
jgi:hypothetical protein